MASPQVENGYTPFANELLEAILRTPLTSREQKCLLAVARETYGWSKKAKGVTAYRISTLTGIQRTQVSRALKALKARNIISNGSEGIGVQKDYEAWLPAMGFNPHLVQAQPGSGHTRSDSDPKTGSKPNRVIGSNSNPHKTRKQESKDTGATATAHQRIMAEYRQLFMEKFGNPPVIAGGRDGTIVKELLRHRQLDEVLTLLRGFFRVGTLWTRENAAYDLPAFKAVYNKLLVMQSRGEL
jgi:phage replication O-like protein O